MQAALELHVRVQRDAPPCTMGRHTRGEAQSPSEVQGSSSCLFIAPPPVLLDDAEVEVDVDVDVEVEDEDEVPAPELELALLDVPLVPELELAPPPVPPGTHWEFWLQE
jgi:hypothetical protein